MELSFRTNIFNGYVRCLDVLYIYIPLHIYLFSLSLSRNQGMQQWVEGEDDDVTPDDVDRDVQFAIQQFNELTRLYTDLSGRYRKNLEGYTGTVRKFIDLIDIMINSTVASEAIKQRLVQLRKTAVETERKLRIENEDNERDRKRARETMQSSVNGIQARLPRDLDEPGPHGGKYLRAELNIIPKPDEVTADGRYGAYYTHRPGVAKDAAVGEYITPRTLLKYMKKCYRYLTGYRSAPDYFTPSSPGYIYHQRLPDGTVRIPGGWKFDEFKNHRNYRGTQPVVIRNPVPFSEDDVKMYENSLKQKDHTMQFHQAVDRWRKI